MAVSWTSSPCCVATGTACRPWFRAIGGGRIGRNTLLGRQLQCPSLSFTAGQHPWQRSSLTPAAAAAAAASPSGSSSGISASSKGQLYEATLGDGSTLWLEVVAAKGPRLQLLCYGELLEASTGANSQLEVRHKGFHPRLAEPWIKRCPGLKESLSKLRQLQQGPRGDGKGKGEGEGGGSSIGGALPSQLVAQHGIAQLRLVTSLEQFLAEVEANPGPWRDGTGPGDPPPTPEETALLTAGELAALLQGPRGVCALQLYVGWGDKCAALQPLLRPFVLTLLQRAAEDKSLLLLPSAAPEGLGASLLLCPRQQPFKAWAEHLAKIGVQASLVADSPYYKALVGRILGYKPENILHHIESMGGMLDSRAAAALEEELKSLSSAAPVLPWTKGKRR